MTTPKITSDSSPGECGPSTGPDITPAWDFVGRRINLGLQQWDAVNKFWRDLGMAAAWTVSIENDEKPILYFQYDRRTARYADEHQILNLMRKIEVVTKLFSSWAVLETPHNPFDIFSDFTLFAVRIKTPWSSPSQLPTWVSL